MTERGVLTAPAVVWDAAVRQAEAIGSLAEKARVGLAETARERRSTASPRSRGRAGHGKLIRIRVAVLANALPFVRFLDNGHGALAVTS
ncbi:MULTISPECIES: hypothetical protein [unclassified Streptomyces]|uniref:hypothetical protein n=1 Tax=unclassified Streptomyces TaxID=2593676 RepID=UPI002E19E2E0